MTIELDIKDSKILYELDNDCRQSDAEIGRKTGLPKQVVSYRIAKLEKAGIIEGYTTQFNLAKIGFFMYKVMLKLQNITPEKEKELIATLKKHPDVQWLVSSFGQGELVFAFGARSNTEFYSSIIDALRPYQKHISDKEIMLIVDAYHFRRSYFLPKKEKEMTHFIGDPEHTPLDKTDIKIMYAINNNARMSIRALARECCVTVDIARYRLKKMTEEGVFQSFRASINKGILGYQYWNVLLKTTDLTAHKEAEIIAYLKAIPAVIFACKYVGSYNFGFEVDVKTTKEIIDILTEFRHRFAGIIESYTPLFFTKEHIAPYYRLSVSDISSMKKTLRGEKQ